MLDLIVAQSFINALSLQVLSSSTQQTWDIKSVELNRPGMQFVGYYEHFANERPQVVGLVEMSYLEALSDELRMQRLKVFFSHKMPCVILCRNMTPPEEMVMLAKEHDIALLRTDLPTTRFFAVAMNYLNGALAPQTYQHGVLVDVYGVGVLITGESGIGKSETALELIKRGHQLVADDSVCLTRVTEKRLVGSSPSTIRHFMEIRGIGIIDIKAMFGIGAVLTSKSVDLVIHLEKWEEKKNYDRLGMKDNFISILDVDLPQILLPVRPGRNLAIVIEVAARNYSLKKLGYSAAKELEERMLNSQKEQHDHPMDLMDEEDVKAILE